MPAVELHLFRIVQEAFNNVHRHARAKSVRLRVSWHDGLVQLSIRDDGNGFVPRTFESEERHGSGIDLVQAMSRQLGGEFVVNRMALSGTCATISFQSKMSRQQPGVYPQL